MESGSSTTVTVSGPIMVRHVIVGSSCPDVCQAARVHGGLPAVMWQDTSKKSPMQLINEVPPIKVEGRIVACEGDNNPALGHPIEFICLDLKDPAICKYCGLRYAKQNQEELKADTVASV
ncbi:NADH dehydrogenase ubiquinone iron-sulfur protein 6, mitochondrial-like protein [Cinnamomum micranthum f. kanehirae]|uniref:NADH dehydrogenase ubiquinone iron-sulfur protein 6, mitochondrial-like protein n=1 Tax=Cinnamomum micranthum f. kanehirae TaxID=337451 RepID=A0A3S3NX88_9MAGN|nr:NADH dehydrogenase ubiquinone iron-sulfur protein 6, mitochondrial-like protein [Cinnamomum micranthum f. kanehirae]